LADYYFHYTSRTVAQMVIASGFLRPLGGAIFLADRAYQSGAEAAGALGPSLGSADGTPEDAVRLTKPIELVCCIPAGRLTPALLTGPEKADPFVDSGRQRLIHAGGGRQFRYFAEIDIRGLAWLQLTAP
jgi:hypothetical protein